MSLPLLEYQERFAFSDARFPSIIAGLGSGKTRAGTARALIKMAQTPGDNIGIFLPTYDLLKLRAMPGMMEDLEMCGINYTVNKSDFRIDVPGLGFIIFRSYDRPERIVSFEVAHSIVDEIDTIKREQAKLVWRKITERTRQKTKGDNSIALITTPDQGFSGFAYQHVITNDSEHHETIRAKTTDNPFLPAGYVEQIRSNYDPILAEMYINGEFVSLTQNKVYHFFNRQQHHADRVITEQDSVLHIGLDFNIGGCCAVVFVIDAGQPVAVDEFVSHDTRDVINNVQSRYTSKRCIIYPDASGRAGRTNASESDIAMIERAGLMVDAPNANPAVRDRINAVNGLLSHNRLLVNTDKCPQLTFALESQGYTDKGEPEKFNDHPSLDDWNDAAGYFIHQRYAINRDMIFTGIESAN
jgi:PBSX family phage terminase large subunit